MENGKEWHEPNGRFAKNNPGKPKGATKNILRDRVKEFLNDNWENFGLWFKDLKEKEKVETMLALLPYAIPRLKQIEPFEEMPLAEEEVIRQEIAKHFDKMFSLPEKS